MRDAGPVRPTILLASTLILVASCGADGRTQPLIDAVARIEIESCRPGPVGRATGKAVSTYGMVTVAHAFEGAGGFRVRGPGGELVDAELVHLDADLDVAVLRLGAPISEPLAFGESVGGGPASLVSAGDADAVRVDDVHVRRPARVRLDGGLRRQAIELDADIVPGDSGGPIVVDGEIVAMVFASSRRSARGWALDVTELRSALDAADVSTPVPLACR